MLIERALPYQFDAQTTFAMEPDGVHCTISLPVSELTLLGNRIGANSELQVIHTTPHRRTRRDPATLMQAQ